MHLIRLVLMAAITLALVSTVTAALADYMLPAAKRTLIILAENWEVQNLNSKPCVSVARDSRNFKWNVDLMWLADRINSDSICTGDHQRLMKEYLAKVQSSTRNKPLMIELSSLDDKSFFVSGLWLFDEKASFERGVKYGSRLLGLTKEQVSAFKTPQEYAKRAISVSRDNWGVLSKSAVK